MTGGDPLVVWQDCKRTPGTGHRMISTAFQVLGLLLIGAALAAAFRHRRSLADALCAAGNLSSGVGDLAARRWGWAAASLAVAAWCGWDWRRRGREKSRRALGAKSRALLAALVKTLRESLRPRPGLRPVPGSAG